jgi:TRAP-type C4-dicarboxylate transport system permease small subunit
MKSARTALVWVGGGALLLAMLVDTLAMLGRQFDRPLLGAIEIVQAAVLIGAAGALLMAALEGAHARVHLLLQRLPPASRLWLGRVHALSATLLWAALLAGSLWITIDLWHGHEHSELVGIPYRPLRVITVLVLLLLLVHALRHVWRGERR